MAKIPSNFSGDKFRNKYNLGAYDFSVQGDELICLSLPNLINADLLDCALKAQELQARIDAVVRKNNARGHAKAVPDWSTWTEAEVLAWFSTNIRTPLATPVPPANTITTAQIRAAIVNIVAVMGKMCDADEAKARMIVAMRDELWPNLKDI